MTKVIIGIVLPFLGTTLGSATVFFLKKEMNSKLQNLLRGFAADRKSTRLNSSHSTSSRMPSSA